MIRNTLRSAVASSSRATASPALSSAARPSIAPRAAVFATPSSSRLYHEKVIDHYENPRNVGSFLKTDSHVGVGLVGAPACGDVMKLSIKVNEQGIIHDVRFKTFGCGSAIASSSLVTEKLRGMTLEEAGKVRNTEIAQELSLPPVKLHCSMLAEDAIKAAIRDYQTKWSSSDKKTAGHIDVSQSVTSGKTQATAHVGSASA
ncbi:unnamed protein product [Parajaminaea phylloscopi]